MSDCRFTPRRTNSSPIAAARIAAGLTQVQLASAIGCTQSMIAQWETGARLPKMQTLVRIAAALHVEWKDLIPG